MVVGTRKGQVSIFIIVGVVILLAVMLAYFVYKPNINLPVLGKDVNVQLDSKMDAINNKIGECVDGETNKALNELAKNGGAFSALDYVSYDGKNYNFLCMNLKGTDKCLSNPISYNLLIEKLDNYLPQRIKLCVDINKFSSGGIEVTAAEPSIKTKINENSVSVTVDYGVTLKKENVKKSANKFEKNVNLPVGAIVDTVNDILNSESEGIPFDPLIYGLKSMGKKIIVVHQPYPHKTFDVSIKGYENFVFRFAVEGESRFE